MLEDYLILISIKLILKLKKFLVVLFDFKILFTSSDSSPSVTKCCCSTSSTGVSGGGTGGNLMKHVQLDLHCGGTSGRLQHRYIGLKYFRI